MPSASPAMTRCTTLPRMRSSAPPCGSGTTVAVTVAVAVAVGGILVGLTVAVGASVDVAVADGDGARVGVSVGANVGTSVGASVGEAAAVVAVGGVDVGVLAGTLPSGPEQAATSSSPRTGTNRQGKCQWQRVVIGNAPAFRPADGFPRSILGNDEPSAYYALKYVTHASVTTQPARATRVRSRSVASIGAPRSSNCCAER